jgi:hypothetical protein
LAKSWQNVVKSCQKVGKKLAKSWQKVGKMLEKILKLSEEEEEEEAGDL